MGQWSKLSAKEKAQIIKFAIDNGVSDINSIRDTYNVYASGGSIHIDKNKKGTFTAAATKHGKSVQEFARQVLANKEDYSPAIVKKAVFAHNSAKWNRYEDGGEVSTNNNRPQDQPQISWIENWLNSRKDVLAKNMAATLFNNYVPVYSPKNNTGDVRDAGYDVDYNYPMYNPLYWLLGQNPRIKQAEKIINREVQNIKNVPVTNVGNEYKPSYGMLGVYVMPSYFDNSGNYVAFLGIPKDEVKIHEFTHASHPEPQENYIKDVLYKDEDIPKSVPGNDKYIQSRELYAALQEVRYKSGLKPNVVVDEQWLENNKKYFENTYLEGLPNNILIRLFNELAQNNNSFKKSNNSYLAALGGGLKSTGGPLYPFSFQKNPYLKVPAVRYGEGGKKLTPSKAQIVRSAWNNENPFNIGLLKNGMYEQYDDPNGEGRDVGPGLLVGATIPDKKLYTRQELDDAAYAFGMEGLASIGKAYNEKYGTEKFPTPFDTVSVAPKLLLLDTRYQNGRLPIANWPALYQSVADGNWAEAIKNSRSTYIKDGVKHYDNDRVRRRAESIFPGMFDVIFTPDSKEFPKVISRKKSKK